MRGRTGRGRLFVAPRPQHIHAALGYSYCGDIAGHPGADQDAIEHYIDRDNLFWFAIRLRECSGRRAPNAAVSGAIGADGQCLA
ncbi:hypothetical protein IVB22_28985 [Bradyrhizobium sp. 190]|nr:hypothetical protein [Bradyrhizobium sp. 190]